MGRDRLDRHGREGEARHRREPALEGRSIQRARVRLRERRARRGAQLDEPPEHLVERAPERTDLVERGDVRVERGGQRGAPGVPRARRGGWPERTLEDAPEPLEHRGGPRVRAVEGQAQLAEPDGLVVVAAHRTPLADLPAQLGAWIAEVVPAIAKQRGFERIETALVRTVALPEGWEGAELVASFTDPLGYTQRYRLLACGRAFEGDLVTVVVQLPETLAHAAPRFLARMLSSVRAE